MSGNINPSSTVEKAVLDQQNKSSRSYFYALKFLSFFVPILYLLITLIHFYGKSDYPFNLRCHLFDVTGIFLLVIIFNLKKTRNFITDKITSVKKSSIHDLTIISGKLFLAVIFYTLIFCLPIGLRMYWHGQYSSESSIIGISVTAYLVTIMINFLGLMMPDLLMKKLGKTNNVKYKYIYWVYFFKSRLVETPIIFLFAFPLLGISLITLCILFLKSDFNDVEKIIYTLMGLVLTICISIATEFLRAYTKLVSVYNDYSNHLIKNRLILLDKFQVIQVGYGNFGSTIMKTLMLDYLMFLNKIIHTPKAENKIKFEHTKYFEIIIDRDYELKLISRLHIVVDTDINKFEETFSDNSFNFKFGFFNCNNSLHAENKDQKYTSFAFPGILADGSNYALWKVLNFSNTPIIINTTSDLNLPIILKKYIEFGSFPQLKKSVVISTVFNENIENQLLTSSDFINFPINYTFYEANGLVHRLCLLLSKIGLQELDRVNLYISCPNETLNDIVNLLRANLLNLLPDKKVDKFLTKNTVIFILPKELSQTVAFNNFPNLMNIRGKRIIFDEHKNITFKDGTKNQYEHLKDQLGIIQRHNIFIAYASDSIKTIKLLTEYRSLMYSLDLKNVYAITSISEDYQEEVSSIISSINKETVKRSIFPKNAQDFIMLKNLTVSNQISAMVLSYQKQYSDYKQSKKEKEIKPLESLFQIELCTNNKPFTLIQLLGKLNNQTITNNLTRSDVVPFFKSNFSFPVRAERELFIFRADFSLFEYNNEIIQSFPPELTHGIILNPSNDILSSKFIMKRNLGCNRGCINCALTSTPGANGIFQKANNYYQSGLGYVKIISKDNNTMGGLLNVLRHLYYGKINAPAEENNDFYNIVYEAGNICPTTSEYLHKFYLSKSTQKSDLKYDGLVSMEIHYTDPKDKLWIEYAKVITQFMKINYILASEAYSASSINFKVRSKRPIA